MTFYLCSHQSSKRRIYDLPKKMWTKKSLYSTKILMEKDAFNKTNLNTFNIHFRTFKVAYFYRLCIYSKNAYTISHLQIIATESILSISASILPVCVVFVHHKITCVCSIVFLFFSTECIHIISKVCSHFDICVKVYFVQDWNPYTLSSKKAYIINIQFYYVFYCFDLGFHNCYFPVPTCEGWVKLNFWKNFITYVILLHSNF